MRELSSPRSGRHAGSGLQEFPQVQGFVRETYHTPEQLTIMQRRFHLRIQLMDWPHKSLPETSDVAHLYLAEDTVAKMTPVHEVFSTSGSSTPAEDESTVQPTARSLSVSPRYS